ncbi:AlbA family DNA-binding domain-containing protein [Streptomyces sp. NPDC002454]
MSRQVDLSELTDLLTAESRKAWVRAALRRGAEGWELFHCWALIGTEPPGWNQTEWLYDEVAFVACELSATELSEAWKTEEGASIELGSVTASVPTTAKQVGVERLPSSARLDRPQLRLPVVRHTLSPTDHTHRQLPSGVLVGAMDAPSFPDAGWAWRAFFEGEFRYAPTSGLTSALAEFRFADMSGWIGEVHVTPTELIVNVEGDGLDGAHLELFGASDRRAERLSGPGVTRLPLPGGLPKDAWLWLKCGASWLDYRSLDPHSTWTHSLAASGVTVEEAADPRATIEALIAGGEGPQVEFKEKLPSGPDRRMLKTVAAFASGDGGTIVFGINRDEMTVVGIAPDAARQPRDELTNLVRATVVPTPQVQVESYDLDGRRVFALVVQPGESPPYAVRQSGTDKIEYFVRRGACTYPAQPGELREAALRRP